MQKESKLARHATDGCENDNADAGAPGLLAEVEALRDRLAALEARLPGNARKDPPRWPAKRQIAIGLTAGAALAVVAGVSVVYAEGEAESVADALFISKNGNIGIGTSTPAAKLQVAGSGWFGPDSGALDAAAGAGVRVFQWDREGVIGDGHRQDAADAWSTCYFTDATFDKYQELGDKNTGMQLLVWNGNSNPARTCELTLIP